MGTDSKKAPPLPAPTETDTATPTELTTDLSKPGDENSTYSLPEDGTPVTIRTRGHKANRSQTSLLIEYFEGGKTSTSASGTERKPSVRVRLTPSKKAKGDHFQVTETKGTRKVSLSRRVPLDQSPSQELDVPEGEDAHSMTSYASATEESNVSRNPIDIEIDRSHRRRRPASPLIPSNERLSYQPGNPSEISAIAPDSFLDGTGPSGDVRSSVHSKGDALAGAALGATAGAIGHEVLQNSKTRGNAKERVKLSEKSRDKDKSDKSDKKRRSKSRTSSVSEQHAEGVRSPRRRSSRTHQDSNVSAGDSALSSYASASHRSLDNKSVRSGASKSSSINNPKLLETVEDAIRRLILPELSALKREQSKRETRRSSLTSTGTSASKEEGYTERRRSSGSKAEGTKESPRHKERRNREARHDYDDISMHSPSRESLGDYRSRGITSPKRSGDLLKAAAAGAAGAAAIKGLSSTFEDESESVDRKQRERRRRRADSRSRSLGREAYDDEHGDYLEPAPPMPLMSDINPSELTRTSILSVDSDRPHSAMEELDTPRDRDAGGAPVTSAPVTPTPQLSLDVPPLSTQHANVSHGDLTALPRGNKEFAEEYETDEFGRKIPLSDMYDERDVPPPVPDYDEYDDDPYDHGYYSVQDVPPPLKYVPYQAGARGLSPIPSVSGYTEAGSEAHLPHHSRSVQSASPEKSPQRLYQSRSIQSMDSIQLSPDNPKNPRFESNTAAGQEVRGISANPDFVHQPFGVESAVASLVEGSALDQSVVTAGSGYDQARDSVASYDSPIKDGSRGFSPEKLSMNSRREYEDDRATPGSRSQSQSQEYSEYELDENGRKVPRARYRQSPTASEAAITIGAVGAAAAALKAAKERKQAAAEGRLEEDFEPAGVFRNKSFKERAMRWQPRGTPTHSLDRYDDEDEEHPTMTASGMPNVNDPMPEIGYVDDDLETNPSVIQGPIGGNSKDLRWEDHLGGQTTPTAEHYDPMDIDSTPRSSKKLDQSGLNIKEAAGAAALGAAAAMATSSGNHEPNQEPDEWRRTSAERKRDTLITNPYEDTSPVTNPALDGDLLKAGALESDFGEPIATETANYGQKFDEGYMSNGPNATPDMVNRGKGLDLSGTANPLDGDEDPFYVPKENPRHLSGMSQGMASPFYDAATGAGIDRIENKDIVALMQHLMVRDAQRSARDTEIVALLMNAALEMRNSFREMKELVQDTGDDMIFANVENTEKLQKAINGPRPLPGAASRSLQSPSQAGTEEVMKKKNLWRRALQGLGSKGTSDLTRIEDMLVQLLGDVSDLKTQNGTTAPASVRGQSLDNGRSAGQAEQEPEDDQDQDEDSVADISGYTTETATRVQMTRAHTEPKFVDHQMATVQEQDEEYLYDQPAPAVQRGNPNLLSPEYSDRHHRGSSVPLDTPPHPDTSQPAALSAENTPKSEKGKKHKSSSSSGWIPKISRWSETTASSVGRAFRGSGASKKASKYDDYQPPSRSGSSLASYDDAARQHDPYGDDKLHSGFSDQNLPTDDIPVAGMPPPPAFMLSDDPKYKAHRNSLNLQHPQPRQGQTERYRTALEYSAQEYDSPKTPRSAEWEGSATSLSRLPGNANRYSHASSTGAKDAEYALESSGHQGGPPRPPKEPLDSSSVHTPQKATRLSQLQKDSPMANPSYESGYGSASGTQASHYTERSPKVENRNLTGARGMPSRRPSGPRAMTPKSPEEEAAREERRRKRGKHLHSILF